MLVYIALIVGCLLLYKGGDWLLEGVIDFGNHMGWPKAITGLLLVSLGTSAPELFVSLGAAAQGEGAMAAGNVLGSNIINIAIVLGLAASVAVLHVERVLQNQLIALLVISVVTAGALWDGQVTRLEGLLLIIILCVSFAFAFRSNHKTSKAGNIPPDKPERSVKLSTLLTVGGIITLLVGAEAMIWGGIELAKQLNIPTSVVALTVTALGTSLPEIAATIVAMTRRESELAIGNVIGSNLMNLGLVLGLSALIVPLEQIDIDTLSTGFFLGLTLFVFIMGYHFKRFARWTGALLIVSYVGYVVALLA